MGQLCQFLSDSVWLDQSSQAIKNLKRPREAISGFNGTTLKFKHTALKEAGFRHRESALVVQAIRSLGAERIEPEIIARIRRWLAPKLRERVLDDTSTVAGWVYDAIREICREDGDG